MNKRKHFQHRLFLLVLALCAVSTMEMDNISTGNIHNNKFKVIPVTGSDILDMVRSSDEKAVLVNIWATWCGPCVEEFPELLKIREEFSDKDVKVLLVSADFDDETENLYEFLDKQNVDFETYIKVGDDMSFIDTFNSDWTGALPVTFLFDRDANIIATWNEKISLEDVRHSISKILND